GPVFFGAQEAEYGQHDQQEDSRDESGREQLIDADLGDQTVKNDRQAGRKKKSEAARRREEPESEPVGIVLLEEHRVEQAAERDNRDPGSPGEGRKYRAGSQCDHGQASRQPAEQ